MSAKKKKVQGNPQQGRYKIFLTDVQEILMIVFGNNPLLVMSNEHKRRMFDSKYIFHSPKAFNEFVSSAEIKIITEKARKFFYERKIESDNNFVSNYQLHLLTCYLRIKLLEKQKEIEKGLADADEVVTIKETIDTGFTAFYTRYLIDYFKIITQLSSPDQRYLGLNIRPAALFKENPKIEILIEVYGFLARKIMLDVKGHKRTAFRMGKPMGTTIVEWITVECSVLGSLYKGKNTALEVYIQSHALRRFKERLDILDKEAINYLLWENTHTIDSIEIYRGFLLLPVILLKVKVGYFVGNIIDDKFLISTFLFVTHSCSPEGDRLKKITGLGKQDISYWHIDRLSTFMNLKADNHPELMELFGKTGLSDLKELKNKDFDIDTLQDANLEAFKEYINKSKAAFA